MKEKKKLQAIENKKARRNFEVLETVEAGIVLSGSEVKSLRAGKGNIGEAHAHLSRGEAFLINMQIEKYQNAGAFGHEESRTRKLLLHRKEIDRLKSKVMEKRLTVVPLKAYFNDRGKVKILLGLARGKKEHDRRQDEKRKEADREIERALKSRGRYE